MRVKTFRKPYQIKRKRSILKNRFFWLSILILIIGGTIFYFLFLSETFQIEKIIVTGEKKVSTKDIELLIEKNLENKILFFKTKSIFWVDTENIAKDILNSFPQIAEVEIGRIFPDALNIIVIERKEVGVFCREGDCFLLDNDGIIFEEAPAGEYLKIKNLTFEGNLKLGEKVIQKEILNQILEIEKKLREDLKIPLTEISSVSNERLNTKTTDGWEIYFNLKENTNWQIEKLSLILEKEIPLEKRRNLEYIDLRFSKIFYKYR